MGSLKTNAARGGVAKLCGQAGNFALRILFIMVLARLLSPQDFGLVAMVTTVTAWSGQKSSTGPFIASPSARRTPS